jgi:hypothetical protein
VSKPGILADVRNYMLHRPAIPTLVEYSSRAEREDYGQRIMQRIDVSVEQYAILNIHRIGVDAPVSFVFEQFRTWGPRSVWWPNRIARLEAADRELNQIRVFFLGRKKHFLGLKFPFFGLNVIPLFDMNVLKIREVPDALDQDNARYMLYRCGGGYPVGIVIVYVRSAIRERGEPDRTHVFFCVGFNFYGKEDWPERHFINSVWETIHNRVTGNVLNRFKTECEARFAEVVAGDNESS